MSKKRKTESANKHRKNPVGVFCSTLGTIVLVLLIFVCVPLTVPRMLGYHIYTVVSGSMEPAIPVGSLVYINNMTPEDVQEGDVIAFYGATDGSSIITHRVVTNGKVVLTVPKMGGLAQTFTSTSGKIAAACMIVLAVVLHIIAAIVGTRGEQEE